MGSEYRLAELNKSLSELKVINVSVKNVNHSKTYEWGINNILILHTSVIIITVVPLLLWVVSIAYRRKSNKIQPVGNYTLLKTNTILQTQGTINQTTNAFLMSQKYITKMPEQKMTEIVI